MGKNTSETKIAEKLGGRYSTLFRKALVPRYDLDPSNKVSWYISLASRVHC